VITAALVSQAAIGATEPDLSAPPDLSAAAAPSGQDAAGQDFNWATPDSQPATPAPQAQAPATGAPVLAGGTEQPAPAETPAAQPAAPAQPAQAQTSPVEQAVNAPFKKHGYVEFDVNHSNLTNGFAPWNGATIQGAIQTDPHNIWSAAVNPQREFDIGGTQGAIGNTHFFNDRVFTNISVGAGSNAIFLPRERVEGSINRRFLSGKNLIGTLDAGYNNGHSGIRDRWVQLGGQYFVPQKPFNFELGARYNNSSPGGIGSHQQYAAATLGTYKKQFLTLRYNWGNEGYQVGVPSDDVPFTPVKFDSHDVSLTWRKWVTHSNGFTASLEQYKNPFFTRNGVQLGVFHDFGN
jgi:YaiO family outer membrane protein